MKNHILRIFFPFIVLLLFAACSNEKHNNNTEKPIICVSIEPQRYFTEAIVGDKFKVVSIVPKGMSPESYDPTPQQLIELDKSSAYLRIGFIGFEQTWLKRIQQNYPQLPVFDTSKNINMILSDHHCSQDEGHIMDPHIWTSPRNALKIAQNTYQAACQIDKKNEAYYTERYYSLRKEIEKIDAQIKEIFHKNKSAHAFIIYHPSLTYFAYEYGLKQLCIENEGKEPTPKQIRLLIDQAKENNVNVVFIQPEFDKRNSEVIAESTGAEIVPISPLNYNWGEEMVNIAKSIARQ